MEGAERRVGAIIETGYLEAVNTKAFQLERYGHWWQMKVIGLLEHGSLVEEGDSILQLDPSNVYRQILDNESELETQLANLEKLIVNQANTTQEIESSLRSGRADFELAKLRLDASKFETEQNRRKNQLQFRQSEITLAKLEKKMELHKIICENDLKIQKIRVAQIERRIQEAKAIIPRLTLRTPVAGVFQVAQTWDGSMVKTGDDIYTGHKLASIPELKWMKVNTCINENDFLKIHVGQKVAVRLDALPQVVFEGQVSYMSKLCKPREEGSRQKVFDVEVRMLQSDERLKPGMTVSCEYLD